ncbi:MAG: cation diffusion facilitator family transporter, partial [bacterium]|nr:cation diffusion facilitator family transporter [bacterium]
SRGGRSRRYPFGRGREIYFWSLLSAFVMFFLAAGFSFYQGYQRFLNPQPIENIHLAFISLSLGFLLNGYAFLLSLRRIVERRGVRRILALFFRTRLVETKNTLVLDLTGTVSALIGLVSMVIYQATGRIYFDALGAMVIGVVMAVLAFALISGIRDFIIGQAASPDTERKIRQAVLELRDVRSVLDLRTMIMGSDRILVNLEVHIRNGLTTDEIEILVDQIKDRVRKKIPAINHVQVELETPEKP